MTTDSLSQIIVNSLNMADLSFLKTANSAYWRGQLKALLSLIPEAGGFVAEELQQFYDYKDDLFFRKFTQFMLGIIETSAEERNKFAIEIQTKVKDSPGNILLEMVDRLDNINKQTAFSNLTLARIHGDISIEDFFRLHSLLERIPYVDLKELPHYAEPFYDTSGDTELLFASGALEMASIEEESNKYILSRLGELLLRWGFGIVLKLEHRKGTDIGLNSLTEEEIDGIINQAFNQL